jgi:hypothetical protein
MKWETKQRLVLCAKIIAGVQNHATLVKVFNKCSSLYLR